MEADDPATQYGSLLVDLKMNSKPMINVLTMMAEDHIRHAPIVVQTIERHLTSVHPNVKLPVLYLIDSIVKNVGQDYPNLFTQNIVSTFCGVFEKVDDKVKQQMFKLRQTWNDVFPARKLYAIDVRCHQYDRNWPISAPPPSNTSSIHVNPKFLNTAQPAKTTAAAAKLTEVVTLPEFSLGPVPQDVSEAQMRAKLLQKHKELLELQQKKIELELMQTKTALESKRFEEMESAIKQEKMLLSQAEMAKSKTDIAHKILSSNFPQASSSSSSLSPKRTKSSEQDELNSSKDKSDSIEKSRHKHKRSSSSSSPSKDKDIKKERDGHSSSNRNRSRSRENDKLQRSSPKHKKDSTSKEESDQLNSSKDKSDSIEKSPRHKHKHSSPSSSSKDKDSKDLKEKERDGHSISSNNKSNSRDKLQRSSPSKHKKAAAIKEEESFRARRSAVLKRSYRKNNSALDADEEENKVPPKMSRDEQDESTNNNNQATDVDLRFQDHHNDGNVEMLEIHPPQPIIKDEPDDVHVDRQKSVERPPQSFKKPPRSSGNGSNMNVDLFGREDVDLRQPRWVHGNHPQQQTGWGPNNNPPRGPAPWIGGIPPLMRSGPRGPFEPQNLMDPNEMHMREREGHLFKGQWVPHRPIGMEDQWGPSPFPDPRGPNPFEEALDHFNPHPSELRGAGPMVERGMFKGPGRRRGGLRGRRGGPGRGAQNMPFPQPLFPESEFPRGLQRPGEFVANPFLNEYRNDVKEEQQINNATATEAGSSSSEDMPPQQPSSSALPDVSSLLALAEQCGLFALNKTEKEPEENGEKKDEIKEPEPIKVPENNNNNNAKESAISKYQKSQQFLRKNNNRNNNNNRKQFAPTPKVIPPPLPTVDVLLVTGDKKYFEERREALINQLWIGMQCATCGLRFSPDQAIKYSQHLDWHFRKNRREKEKKNAKKAQSRAWYYILSDWIQFEELEDLEDRAASVFELQINESETASISPSAMITIEESSVLASGHEGAMCPQCGEQFQSYYDEDKEEWRLNDAILDGTDGGEDKVYHVVCHLDYLKSTAEEPVPMEQEHSSVMVDDLSNDEEQQETPSTAEGTIEKEVEHREEELPTASVTVTLTPAPMDVDDDDEVLILKEGKKEIKVVEIDVDDEDGLNSVKSDEISIDDDVKIKEFENGPLSPKESSSNNTNTENNNNSDNIVPTTTVTDKQPVRNYSIISRPISSPITVIDDDSSSNLLPGISEDSVGGVFGFALNSGIRRERSESPEPVGETRILYKSMVFDFPKIKIEPPDDYENVAVNVPEADSAAVNVPMMQISTLPQIHTLIDLEEPIDLTGEDDSVDAVDGPRPLHQTTSIDGNLHQEVYVPISLVPPPKIRINISGIDIGSKSPQSKPENVSSPKPTPEIEPPVSPSTTTAAAARSPQNSDSESTTTNNAEIVFTDEIKRLKPSLAKFIDSGRKFKKCPPKEGRKEESGLCVIC